MSLKYFSGIDIVIGDPVFTVPINIDSMDDKQNLCYEIHGKSETSFNFVSDKCVSVNAKYIGVGNLNFITAIAVRAQGNSGNCRDIRVDLENCAVSTGPSGSVLTTLNPSDKYAMDGINIRQRPDRVRIAVPNCADVMLVMWVICERDDLPMIRFQIARGRNLEPTSHGLVGKWVMVIASDFSLV